MSKYINIELPTTLQHVPVPSLSFSSPPQLLGLIAYFSRPILPPLQDDNARRSSARRGLQCLCH